MTVAEDRYRLLIVFGSFVVFCLMVTIFGISVSQYQESVSYKNRGDVAHSTAQVLLAIMRELELSVDFVFGSVDPTMMDRDQTEVVETAQAFTRQTFRNAEVTRLRVCPECPSLYQMFSLPDLISMQYSVINRNPSPVRTFEYYSEAMSILHSIVSYFTGYAVTGGLVRSMWLSEAISATRTLATIGSALISMRDDPQSSEFAFDMTAVSTIVNERLESTARLVETHDPSLQDRFRTILSVPQKAGSTFFSGVTGDFSALQLSTGTPPADVINETLIWLNSTLGRIESINASKDMVYNTWLAVIILSLITALLVVGALVLALLEATAIIWAGADEVRQIQASRQLEMSLARMKLFVDRMYNLDPVGVDQIARLTAESTTGEVAEQELILLDAPVRRVLSFVSPIVLARVRQYQATVAQSNAALLYDGFHDSNCGAATEATSLGDTLELGLQLEFMCLVYINISCFNEEIKSDTARSLPKDITACINELVLMAAEYHGTLLYISGITAVLGWNILEKVDKPENMACHMLLNMRKGILTNHITIRCAVVSGIVRQGVLGTDTLRSYVVVGSLAATARFALHVARLHGVHIVIDKSTFLRLDTRRFDTRALERIGLDFGPGLHPNETTIYEMNGAGENSNEYYLLWNAAYDNYLTGHREESNEMLRRWSRQYGHIDTVKRFLQLSQEQPTPRLCSYLHTTGEGFEYRLFV